MRLVRSLLLSALLLTLPLAAQAGFVNLAWNACAGDGGIDNRVFACNTNAGSELLVASFAVPNEMHGVTGLRLNVALAVAGTTLPAWWQFKNAGTCRQTALSVGGVIPATATVCEEWSDGPRATSFTYTPGAFIANGAMMDIVTPPLPVAEFDLFPGHEYFAATISISNAKTVGTGACAGCLQPGCIVLQRLTVLHLNNPALDEVLPYGIPRREAVLWQGGAGVAIPNFGGAGFTYCTGATPTRRSTWEQVKTLYR